VEALQILEKIASMTSFRIRFPVTDIGIRNISLSVIVKHLPNLKFLDFSNILGASSFTISDLVSVITGSHLNIYVYEGFSYWEVTGTMVL
jgi:hypothetical protein